MIKANLNKCRSRKTGHRLESPSKPIARKSAESDSHQGALPLEIKSKTTSSSIPFTKRFCVPVGEKVKDVFSNDDIAVQILSRLPIESINGLKSVCKRWFAILSQPYFRGAHFQMSQRNLSGLFMQMVHFCNIRCFRYFDFKEVDYIAIGKDGQITITADMLDFLPEKVVIIASCNGILLCRSHFQAFHFGRCDKLSYKKRASFDEPKEVVLYVCNPWTKEFTSLKPEGKFHNGCCYGFACDSSGIINFEVIMIECPVRAGKEPYLFRIYSSKTGTWRLSKAVCSLTDRLCVHNNTYVNGVFYWLIGNHDILAFDLKQDSCGVISLPGDVLTCEGGVCLGVSEGQLHYICFNTLDFFVWFLDGDKWTLKHSTSVVEMDHKTIASVTHKGYYPPGFHHYPNSAFHPMALHGNIVYMRFFSFSVIAYNFKTGKFEKDLCSSSQLKGHMTCIPVMIPYCKSILQVPSVRESSTVEENPCVRITT